MVKLFKINEFDLRVNGQKDAVNFIHIERSELCIAVFMRGPSATGVTAPG